MGIHVYRSLFLNTSTNWNLQPCQVFRHFVWLFLRFCAKIAVYTALVPVLTLSKKKIVVFLLTVVLCSGATLVYSAQSGADESTKPLFNNSGSLHGNQPNLTVGSDGNLDAGGLFFKMILMVLLVVIFGVAAIYLSKKLLPRFSRLPGKRIQVCETVHLGPRKAIHLIKIGKQTLLIGSTNENVTKLADVTDESPQVDLPANQIGNN